MTGNMHSRHVYQVPAFTGELLSTIDFDGGFANPPKAVYTLNGQAISEQQFKAYESSLNLPGMNNSNDGSTTGGWPGSDDDKGALNCRVDVMIPVGAIRSTARSYSSCGRSNHLVDTLMGRQIEVVFKSTPSYMSLMTKVCQNSRCEPMAQRDFLPNEERAYDDMIGDWMIHSSCTPVVGCP